MACAHLKSVRFRHLFHLRMTGTQAENSFGSSNHASVGNSLTIGLAFTPPRPDFTTRNFFPLLQVAISGSIVAKAGSGLGWGIDALDGAALVARLPNDLRELELVSARWGSNLGSRYGGAEWNQQNDGYWRPSEHCSYPRMISDIAVR